MTVTSLEKPVERKLDRKEFNKIYWRSFTLLGSFNSERMEGLGFLYAIMPSLKRIWGEDTEEYKEAMHRHIAAFNMTVAPSPFVMGIAVAMEEMAKDNPEFDKASINAIKVSLMGPLSGIGDTFFWGIFKVLACSLGISFASQGSILGPIILLLAFNVPNFLTRYYGLKIGYNNGNELLANLQKSGKMQLFTYCAGIVGVASIGCMVASWIGITCPLSFEISGSSIVIQDYLNDICPELLSLSATLIIFRFLKKKDANIMQIIIWIVIIAFVCGCFGILA